jgi:hypothetical protein
VAADLAARWRIDVLILLPDALFEHRGQLGVFVGVEQRLGAGYYDLARRPRM